MRRIKCNLTRREAAQLAVVVLTDLAVIAFALWMLRELALAAWPDGGTPLGGDDYAGEHDDDAAGELAAVLPFPAWRAGVA